MHDTELITSNRETVLGECQVIPVSIDNIILITLLLQSQGIVTLTCPTNTHLFFSPQKHRFAEAVSL